ncbi:MAG: hypothetical protein A2Y61_00195 [Chloroflexi bacterium RBG_13_60_13]|nr:MAG: hypothetical protein A2Y61_00195 [Chloroflexi bacterium RBG_13_60_13]
MIEIRTQEDLIPVEILGALSKQQLTGLARVLAELARGEWIRLGSQDPSSRRNEYIRSIQQPRVGAGTAVISLVGSVANLLEHGDSGGEDLRDTLLGPGVPPVPRGERGKHEAQDGGYYRAIPFRHGTPGTTGKIVGAEMGVPYSKQMGQEAAKRLGKEVYGQAKKLKAYGTPNAKPEDVRLPAGLAGKLKDHHKTDIFAGMIREEQTYEKATQSQYFTFRTISTHVWTGRGLGRRRAPATVGWKTPQIRARNYAQQVARYIEEIAPEMARQMLEVQP